LHNPASKQINADDIITSLAEVIVAQKTILYTACNRSKIYLSRTTWVLPVHICRHLSPTSFCRRPVNQNTPSRCVLGGWAWLTSITPAVIGRPSQMLAYNSARPTFLRCLRHLSANVNSHYQNVKAFKSLTAARDERGGCGDNWICKTC